MFRIFADTSTRINITHAILLSHSAHRLDTRVRAESSVLRFGAAGYRSLCLNVANVALYHVSYSPK
jgi:hypothetical protein